MSMTMKGNSMKTLGTILAFLSLMIPCYAAPRNCRLAARVNRVHVAANAKLSNDTKTNFVVTAFAVPVAVPVAPFAPYWYGVAEFHDPVSMRVPSSFPRSAWERTAVEAPPRETAIVAHRCGACHGSISPKQGLSLVDPTALSAEDRLRALRAVVTGAMPPETEPKLSDADRNAIIHELLGETDENSNDQ
jgi:hypothetical protein